MATVIPAKQDYRSDILNFAMSLAGYEVGREQNKIEREKLELEQERSEVTDAYTKALTEKLQLDLDEQKKLLLDKEYQEKLRQSRVAALSGQIDASRKLKGEADELDAKMSLYDQATSVEDKARILLPHYMAGEMRTMQLENAILGQQLAGRRAEEDARHNAEVESRALYQMEFGSDLTAAAGTPMSAEVKSTADALFKLSRNSQASPEAVQAARDAHAESLKRLSDYKMNRELEILKAELDARAQTGEQQRLGETGQSVALKLVPNAQMFASPEDHAEFLKALVSKKEYGKDFMLEPENQNWFPSIPGLNPKDIKLKFVPINNGNKPASLEEILQSVR